MNVIILISLIVAASAYTDIDDSFDFEAMMKTPSELRTLLDCYLDKIPCPKKYVPYRMHADEAVSDGCRECNVAQKHNGKLILKELKQLFPEDFAKLIKKYDKDGTHFNSLIKEVSNY